MKFTIAVALTAIGVGFAGIAVGQDDPIAARQALMKANGAAMKTASDMVKGEVDYDATAAAAAMQKLQEDMTVFVTLFPEGSDEGDTDASPAIWENFADFEAKSAKLVADAKAAEEAAAGGLEGFQAAFQTVASNCGGCHRVYRK